MSDLFDNRMNKKLYSSHYPTSLANKTIRNANYIEHATFTNDPNFHQGQLYDWDLKPLYSNYLEKKVDYKIQKTKTFSPEVDMVDYVLQFRPGFYPEQIWKQPDGKERAVFYIDVPDLDGNGQVDKWLIYGKDDRHSFDRYSILKCNWVFEWTVDDPKNYRKTYHQCLGVLRDGSNENAVVWRDIISRNMVQQMYFFVPTNDSTRTIDYNMRFILSDNPINPKVYEVWKIVDSVPLGITKVVLRQVIYNSHTDFIGTNEDLKQYDTVIGHQELPDLPERLGGKIHQVCNILKSDILMNDIPNHAANADYSPVYDDDHRPIWTLNNVADKIKINSKPLIIQASYNGDAEEHDDCSWHIFVDNNEYNISDLTDYFDITINNDTMSVRVIDNVMAKYILKIAIYDNNKTYYDSVEMQIIE